MFGFLSTLLWWIFFAVAFLALVSFLRQPAPHNSQPLTTKFSAWIMFLMLRLVTFGADRGWWDRIKALRYISDVMIKRKGSNVQTQDAVFDGVKVKLYLPKLRSDKCVPGFIYYHGGGWVLSRADTHDRNQAKIAADLGAVLVSVDYPRRPECSLDELYGDSYKAARYFIKNAGQWNVDPNRIAVGGVSSGANIAASLAIRLRDEKFSPMPKLQVLLYGTYQVLDQSLPSYIQYYHGPLLDREFLITMLSCFIFGKKWEEYYSVLDQQRLVPLSIKKQCSKFVDHSFLPVQQRYPPYRPPYHRQADMKVWEEFKDVILDPRVSPLLTEDLSNLPGAHIVSSEYDTTRDESFLYARRLEEAGNKVTHHNNPLGVHSSAISVRWLEYTEHTLNALIDFMKDHL